MGLHLRLRAAVMDDLAAVLESPCLHWPPEALAAPSPCGSGLRELFDSPLMQVVAPCPSSMVADEEEPGEASPSPAQGPGQVIKKLSFGPDGVGAAVPVDLPPEVVLFILVPLLSDDVSNQNCGAIAVSSAWRRAAGWLAESWAGSLHTCPLAASPSCMRLVAPHMVEATRFTGLLYWYPCGRALRPAQVTELVDAGGWLSDDTICLFFTCILQVTSLSEIVVERPGSVARGLTPSALLLEPHFLQVYSTPGRRADAINFFHRHPHPELGFALYNLFVGVDTIYAPVLVGGSHWIFLVVWLRFGYCEVYDSMGGLHRRTAHRLVTMLEDMCSTHCLVQLRALLDIKEWGFIHHRKGGPQQHDGAACGVFVCLTALCLFLRRPVTFSHREVMYWRLRIAYLIATHPTRGEEELGSVDWADCIPSYIDASGAIVLSDDDGGGE